MGPPFFVFFVFQRKLIFVARSSQKRLSKVVRVLFEKAKEVADRIGCSEVFEAMLEHYLEASDRCEAVVTFRPKGSHCSKSIILQNCSMMRQNALRRVVSLTRGGFHMIESENVLGLALITRAHMESTCQIGYYCAVVRSFLDGNTAYKSLYEKLLKATIGASHEMFSSAPNPINVLYYVEKSEKYFPRLNEQKEKLDLRDKYDFLSEFCHPNFCSSIVGHNFDPSEGKIVYDEVDKIDKKNSVILDYLSVMTALLIVFDNEFSQLKAELAEYTHWPNLDFRNN